MGTGHHWSGLLTAVFRNQDVSSSAPTLSSSCISHVVYSVKMFQANIPVFTISGSLAGLTILSIDVHTSSIFIVFLVLSMIFLFISRRSYYHYYDRYHGCQCSCKKAC